MSTFLHTRLLVILSFIYFLHFFSYDFWRATCFSIAKKQTLKEGGKKRCVIISPAHSQSCFMNRSEHTSSIPLPLSALPHPPHTQVHVCTPRPPPDPFKKTTTTTSATFKVSNDKRIRCWGGPLNDDVHASAPLRPTVHRRQQKKSQERRDWSLSDVICPVHAPSSLTTTLSACDSVSSRTVPKRG